MTELQGYPETTIYITIILGTALAILRPYWVLCGVLFVMTAVDRGQAVFTRTEVLGPYFNLFDALLVVMMLASLVGLLKKRRKPIIPAPVVAVLIVLIVSWFNIALQARLEYEVLRAIRWSLNFPLVFIAMANAIDTEKQVKYVFLSLFLGSTLAALQHIFLVAFGGGVSGLFYGKGVAGLLRTLAFVSAGVFFLVSAPFMPPPRQKWWRLAYFLALIALAISTLLNQTRSIWIALVLSVLTIGFLLGKLGKSILVFSILTIATLLVFQFLLQDIAPLEIVSTRFRELAIGVGNIDSSAGLMIGVSERGRAMQIEAETRMWLEGNWFIGRGIGYTDLLQVKSEYGPIYDLVAWGHVGHVAYLSRLGLFGLLVLSAYLPIASMRNVLMVVRNTDDEYILRLAYASMGTVIFGWYVAFMSSSYLEWTAMIPGVFFGAIWAMRFVIEQRPRRVEGVKVDKSLSGKRRRKFVNHPHTRLERP